MKHSEPPSPLRRLAHVAVMLLLVTLALPFTVLGLLSGLAAFGFCSGLKTFREFFDDLWHIRL